MNEDFLDLLSALNAADARFLLVGGYAVGVHGRPNKRAAARPQDLADVAALERLAKKKRQPR